MFLLKKSRLLLKLVIALFFTNAVIQAQNCSDGIHKGEGTFYGGVAGSSGGNCGLPVPADDFLHCALNTIDYNGSEACGACIEVEGTKGKSIVLKVVDRCPECKEGDVDLHEDAFALIDDPISGRIPITWKYVSCPLKNDNKFIHINFKSGSTKYWTAIQLRNITQAIKTLEYKDASGSWVAINRVLFNFFIETKGIDTPMTLRVTSVLGEQLLFDNVDIDVDNDFNTNQQFENLCDEVVLSNFQPTYTEQIVQATFLENEIKLDIPSQEWEIYDMSGKKVSSGKQSNRIDIYFLSKGIYFLRVDMHKTIKFYKD
ncbi:expansin EXLX1 family cellulose-binding protein [Aquimarina agarilytica]|uniref:expansin EXLX1 family cellulose-binding protein n=1 Tax=Aquimarina agarilytica TaxID=1087449 RepID=UPI0002887772|nr:expansin EXLX1 family cellulose-binding protein [Aquimarina agarilytica]